MANVLLTFRASSWATADADLPGWSMYMTSSELDDDRILAGL